MRIRVWAIGLFIVLGLGFATAILFLIGSRQKAFDRHVDLYTEFSSLGGMQNGATVQVSGLNVGQVKEIQIPKTPSAKFRLKLQIEEKVIQLVRSDSMVSIETEGVVGDKFILIKKGSDGSEQAKPDSTLPSKEPFDLGALTGRASGLLTDVQGSLDEVRGRLDSALATLNTTVSHVDIIVRGISPHLANVSATADTMMLDLKAGKGSAGLLLRDDATREQLRSTLLNVHQASADAQQAMTGVRDTVEDVQSRNLVANLQQSLDNVQSMTQQLGAAVTDALSQDSMGRAGSQNLRETMSNLNIGTANLAEDTEALKHNFFLRGFFKKRGFYSLDEINSTEYLAALKRNKRAKPRLWIQATAFDDGEDSGQEQLSEAGRSAIDLAVGTSVERLPGSIIVVEGYAAAGPPDEQFVVSRRRADLVRRYLELRFHLRNSDIGIVALLAKPPEDAGRSSWDGVSIVVLKASGGK